MKEISGKNELRLLKELHGVNENQTCRKNYVVRMKLSKWKEL